MKTTILGTRQLPLPRVPTATLKGFLMVYQHKNIKHGHLKIITMIRKKGFKFIYEYKMSMSRE